MPPLDGGNVLPGLVPEPIARADRQLRPYGFLILYALMLTGVLGAIMRSDRSDAILGLAAVMTTTGKRVVSGMRPTGRLHLGHLVGALQNWEMLQREYDCFYFVADWHALTSDYARHERRSSTTRSTTSPTGLAPASIRRRARSSSSRWCPSTPSCTCCCRWSRRFRGSSACPTYKEQIEQLAEKDLSNIGFLGYPLLQTADVVDLQRALRAGRRGSGAAPGAVARSRAAVPQFLRRACFVEPQPLLTPTPRLPGLDNRKMSKSYGNTIDLSDTPEDVVKKVRQMYTDPKRVRADIPGTVEGNPVFIYHDAFNPNRAEVEDLKARYRAGKVGDVEVKTKLAAAINAHARSDPRAARRRPSPGPATLRDMLRARARARARAVAQETMARVRDAVKLRY